MCVTAGHLFCFFEYDCYDSITCLSVVVVVVVVYSLFVSVTCVNLYMSV